MSSELHVDAVVVGGTTRSESVRAGLAEVPDDVDIVVVHDAARPLATAALYAEVISAVADGADAAVPGVAVSDTIKRVKQQPSAEHSAVVIETVDRSELVAVQTPQAFNASVLRRAHAASAEASDDAGLIEALGGTVVVVPGLSENNKITLATDLVAMEAVMTK